MPASGATMTSRQSGPSVAQPWLTVGVLRGDLRADALELAADVLEAVAVLIRRQVRGVRVLEGIDHPADGALDQGVAVDLAAGIALGDRVVGVPERAERLVLADRRAGLGPRPGDRASSRT